MERQEGNDRDKGMKEPLLIKPSSHQGGFRTIPFIIVHEGFERAAFFGLQPNMIVYLMGAYGLDMATGSNIIFLWTAATNITPIVGAFLADSCVSRFWLISFGSISTLLGIMLLWSTTIIPGVRPVYEETTAINSQSATAFQLMYLCLSFVLLAIGAGGIRSSTLAFGADQLITKAGDEEDAQLDCSGALQSLFNWYYLAVTSSMLFAMTAIVYIQDHMGWQIGFAVPVSLMLLSAISFFSASSFYVKLKPMAGALTSFAQVVVAAWKNRHYKFPSHLSSESRYYVAKGSSIATPSEKQRFLNKACIIMDNTQEATLDEMAVDLWHLCTTDQVEQFKSIINIIPLWSTGIIFGVTVIQSLNVVQAEYMDRHFISQNFEIPPGSLGTFGLITAILWLILYNHMFIPLASKAFSKNVCIDAKTRMGIGLLLSFSSMAVSASVESVRRGRASVDVPMSAMWLVPQICLKGLSEVFTAIAQIEFFYSEFPKSMSSISSNLYGLSLSIASIAASVIISIVNHVTAAGGKDSWVASDPNKGHYDYYYWVLAALSLLNYMYFLICSRAYIKDKRDGQHKVENRSR